MGPHRTLYASRPLLNGADLRAWAAEQGLPTALPAEDMHVTVAFSRAPVIWERHPPLDEHLGVIGGARRLMMLGTALVLRFASPALEGRWTEFCRDGASWDFPEYHPHVTLSYAVPPGLSLDRLHPFTAPLMFGPERFKELDLNWKAGVAEKPLASRG